MTVIISNADPMDGTKPMSGAQGRYGEVILVQGHGVKPRRWTGGNTAHRAGIKAPDIAAVCTPLTPVRYYVARCDVTKPGACYNRAPAVTFATPANPPAGFRAAKAKSYLDGATVGEVVMEDGGKYYPDPPSVSLSATHGTGGVITVTMDRTLPSPNSITQVEIVDGPPFAGDTEINVADKTQWGTPGPIEVTVSNAGGTVSQTWWIYSEECDGPGGGLFEGWGQASGSIPYTISGSPGGSGLKIRVGFYGYGFRTVRTDPCYIFWWGSWGVDDVTILNAGSGYAADSAFTITMPSAQGGGRNLVLEARTPGNSGNTSTPRAAIKSLAIPSNQKGSGYTVAPELKVISDSGFGASAYCTVNSAGQLDTVVLESGGGGFKTTPTVQIVSGGAEAFAVARPHVRGKYQCYYRYVDSTAAANGGPITSSLSPVREFDAGEGAAGVRWTVYKSNTAGERATNVELWRTTGDQATALYRVATITSFSGTVDAQTQRFPATFDDDLTDEELRNPDRAGYAAMPIVLPNGELNANRFEPPPDNKAVVVRFQDRFWYGVDTSGTEPNSIYFSEVDEPESVPDINELVLQQNTGDTDVVTGLAPFGSLMLVMQNRHLYSFSYSNRPLVDGDLSLLAHRGCVNQRCWAIDEGICYALDQDGLYSIQPSGQVEGVSDAITNLFRRRVNWAARDAFFVAADPATSVVRVFLTFIGDYPPPAQGQPVPRVTRVLCYSVKTNTWWEERYPQRLYGALSAQLTDGTYRSITAGDSGLLLLGEGRRDIARGSINVVSLTNPGSGYRKPPTVTAPVGSGAEFQAYVDATGKLTGIAVISPGYGYSNGNLTISTPDEQGGVAAVASYTVSNNDVPYFIPYRMRTGSMSLPNDMTEDGAGSSNPRDISLAYEPQPTDCEVALRLYYNNSQAPRSNVAPRNRGVGFRQSVIDCSSRLNMGKLDADQLPVPDTGVAKAVFSGRTIDDIRSSDRRVAVEIAGSVIAESDVTFYELDVYGTSEQ